MMTEWGFVLRVAPCLPMDVRVHSRGAEVESAERERGGGGGGGFVFHFTVIELVVDDDS